jgi:hypothetical protein
MDKGTIIARALALLGNHIYTEQAATHSPAEQHFPDVMLEANAAHNWSFARSEATLYPDVVSGKYLLPVDCLLVRRLSTPNGFKLPYGWELLGRYIKAHNYTGDISIVYTRNLLTVGNETPALSPFFTQYVVHLLAARICPQTLGTEGLQLADAFQQKADAYRVQAITQDRQQDAANDQRRPSIYRILRTSLY